jgi:hypothetical protein
LLRKLVGTIRRSHQRADSADHPQNAGNIALIEDVDGCAGAHQVGDDVGLEVRERQHQVGLEREDFWDIGGDEGRDPRLLAAHPWRPHRIAGDADDAILLAEQIQGLDGFFGKTDDSAWRELAHNE